MKTYSTYHTTTYDSELRHVIASKLGTTGNIRVTQIGAGVVILPDTNRTQDLSENEMRKALHIEEKTPKEETRKVKLYSKSSHDDMEPQYLELTEEQYRLLTWLFENDWLFYNATFIDNPPLDFKRI